MIYVGIDPGAAGGIACVDADGTHPRAVGLASAPTPADLLHLVAAYCIDGAACLATIEAVHSSPQMGVTSSFSFGRTYGRLEMALVASGVRWETVTPATWQRALRCLTRGDKNVSKARAQQLFPGLRITHAIADALLIAEYGRRHALGIITAVDPAPTETTP